MCIQKKKRRVEDVLPKKEEVAPPPRSARADLPAANKTITKPLRKLSSEQTTPSAVALQTRTSSAQKEEKKLASKKKEKAEATPVFSATQHTKKKEPMQKTQNEDSRVEEDTLDNVALEMPEYCAEKERHFEQKIKEVKLLMEQRAKHFNKV